MQEKELRLALVCYGGVSLAIYMHGITREIWHLLRASRFYHDSQDIGVGGEAVYHDLMAAIEATSGTKMRILTDIIAGSSAGGINGIFLSQAIVTGQSLEPLTDLWLRTADVETLLDPDARPFSRFSKFWMIPIIWLFLRRRGGAIARTVSKDSRDEVASKLSGFVRARWFKPPFGGRGLSKLLFDAFEAMDKSDASLPLIPHNQPLDLFVTVTDFAGHDQVLRLNSPEQVIESEHRITISFDTRRRADGLLAEIPELVFAARATSSFPGAFPAFSARELDGLIKSRKTEWKGRDAFLQRILPQQYAAGTAADTMLIDGSVLANAPFNQAIGALRNRPARREIDRRIVYIDPKPGRPSFRFNRKPGEPISIQQPGWLATILGASSNIPREQPIRDSLDKIDGRTERIERMRIVTDGLHVEIERSIQQMLGKTWFLSKPTAARVEKWRATANEKAANAAGYSYPAYGHLKIVGVVDDMIALAKRGQPDMPADHFRCLRKSMWKEIRARGLETMSGDKGIGATPQSIQFFRDHDVRFRVRRLRFLTRRLADEVEQSRALDAPDTVDGVSAVRDTIYECLALYLVRETSDYMGSEFAEAVKNGCEEAGRLIDMMAKKRELIATDRLVDGKLLTAFLGLNDEPQKIMLLGYLGYPLYDIATLPLLQGEGLDEFDPVKVDRISPEDALTIRKGGAVATLKGIEFNNFGAFFSRAYRENDYLWGRLHGAERLIDIVISSSPNSEAIDEKMALSFKKRAFQSILDREEPRLRRITSLIQDLRKEIAVLACDDIT
jgi:patatin-related protein